MQTELKIIVNSPEEATVIIEILSELSRAISKHPTWPISPVERAAIVSEEAGEVIREANHLREGHGDIKLLRSELIQTAGVCIRMLNIMNTENDVESLVETESFKGKGLKNYFPNLNAKVRNRNTDNF